jgi:hypothetical protein
MFHLPPIIAHSGYPLLKTEYYNSNTMLGYATPEEILRVRGSMGFNLETP